MSLIEQEGKPEGFQVDYMKAACQKFVHLGFLQSCFKIKKRESIFLGILTHSYNPSTWEDVQD